MGPMVIGLRRPIHVLFILALDLDKMNTCRSGTLWPCSTYPGSTAYMYMLTTVFLVYSWIKLKNAAPGNHFMINVKTISDPTVVVGQALIGSSSVACQVLKIRL